MDVRKEDNTTLMADEEKFSPQANGTQKNLPAPLETRGKELNRNISEISAYNGEGVMTTGGEIDHDWSVNRFKDLIKLPIDETIQLEDARGVFDYIRNSSSDTQVCPGSVCWVHNLIDTHEFISFFAKYLNQVIEGNLLCSPKTRAVTNFIKLHMTVWNASDNRDSICKRLVEYKVNIALLTLLQLPELSNDNCTRSGNIRLIVHCSLGTLHNITSKLLYIRGEHREHNAVSILTPYVKDEGYDNLTMLPLRTAALLLLAFLVDENENKSLNATDEHVIYIVSILEEALKCDKLYSDKHGYHATEILHGLKNIAGPDLNKRSLVKHGVLDLILKALSFTDQETEVQAALDLLWSLSFSDDCRLVLVRPGDRLRDQVQLLQTSSDNVTAQSAQGILWNLGNKFDRVDSVCESLAPVSEGHVMISYQHSTQRGMVKIKEALIHRGYRVWMDVDYMTGSFVDAMAEAVQQAAVLVLGLCQAFKNSPHCRQELRFAYTRKIPLVPILLEPNFEPDGWLGFLLATIIHTDFTNPEAFEDNMFHLGRQLGPLGKDPSAAYSQQPSYNGQYSGVREEPIVSKHVQFDTVDYNSHSLSHGTQNITHGMQNLTNQSHSYRSASQTSQVPATPRPGMSRDPNLPPSDVNNWHSFCAPSTHTTPSRPLSQASATFNFATPPLLPPGLRNAGALSSSFSSAPGNFPPPVYGDWTPDRVLLWLQAAGLIAYSESFSDMTGELLRELIIMRRQAPESFYATVRGDFKMPLIDLLKLTRSLGQLEAGQVVMPLPDWVGLADVSCSSNDEG